MKLFRLFFFLLLIQSMPGLAQKLTRDQKIDSLHNKFKADSARIYRNRKYKFLLALDNRNSFAHTNQKISLNISGIQLGVVINDKHSLALGFYSAVGSQKATIRDDQSNQDLTVHTHIGYATFFYEYSFIDTKRWELGVPVEIGTGSYQTTVTDTAGKPYRPFHDTLQRPIVLLGLGLDVTFRVWRWLGLNAMGGYRLVAGDEPKKVNLNGLFYSYGVQIYFGELYRMARLGTKRRIYKNALEKAANMPD